MTSTGRTTQELDVARLRLSGEMASACERLHRESPDAVVPVLEEPVRAFARQAHLSGSPVERMVVLLKECLSETELARLDQSWYGYARDQLLRWALDSYYTTDGPPPR